MTRPLPLRELRPPTPHERVRAAATEVLLGRLRTPPPPLVARLLDDRSHAPERAPPKRP